MAFGKNYDHPNIQFWDLLWERISNIWFSSYCSDEFNQLVSVVKIQELISIIDNFTTFLWCEISIKHDEKPRPFRPLYWVIYKSTVNYQNLEHDKIH